MHKKIIEKEQDVASRFLPYHYPAIFHRTFKAAMESEGVVCALISATATEAFIHDFIGWYNFVATHPIKYGSSDWPVDNYLTMEEKDTLERLKNAEENRDSVLFKFNCFTEWNTSEKVYQDFKTLITIRNALAHPKSEELVKHSEKDFKGYPKFLNNFFQKKIIIKPKEFISWIEVIETQEFCLWCQNAAYNMVKKTIDQLPETNTKKHFKKEIYFYFDIDSFRRRYNNSA